MESPATVAFAILLWCLARRSCLLEVKGPPTRILLVYCDWTVGTLGSANYLTGRYLSFRTIKCLLWVRAVTGGEELLSFKLMRMVHHYLLGTSTSSMKGILRLTSS